MSDPHLRQRTAVSARARPPELPPNLQRYADTGEALVAEPFRGITTNGHLVPSLFALQPTGVSTQPVLEAAEAFLASLGSAQRERASFSRGHGRLAPLEQHPPVHHAARRRPGRADAGAARARPGAAARRA